MRASTIQQAVGKLLLCHGDTEARSLLAIIEFELLLVSQHSLLTKSFRLPCLCGICSLYFYNLLEVLRDQLRTGDHEHDREKNMQPTRLNTRSPDIRTERPAEYDCYGKRHDRYRIK